jgi:hypothetical protein
MAESKLAQTLRAYQRHGLQKVSALGGDPEAGFESSFASLAYVYIRDKAPALLDYMVGFQLVDKNEDNTKAVGIFGFKMDNQWVYAPVFFINGDLKGHELLYLKDQDTFVPMKENWINYLISKQPAVLGKATPETMKGLGGRQPNLYDYSNPPALGKFSSVMPKLASWAQEIMPAYAVWCVKHPDRMAKFAGLNERLDLEKVLAEDIRLVKSAVAGMKKYPLLKQAFQQYYTQRTLVNALQTIKSAVLAQPTGILSKSAAADTFKKLEVITDNAITVNTPEMNETEREKLLRDGVLIRDHRSGEEISKAYNVQIPQSLASPDTTDVYDVLTRDGGFDECLVVHQPHCGNGRKSKVLVVRLSDKAYNGYHPANVFVRQSKETKSPIESYQKWWDGLSDSKSLTKRGKYLLIAQNGQGTGIFEVEDDLGDDTYKVYWKSIGYDSPPSYLPETARSDVFETSEHCHTIVFNKREGTSFKSMRGTLYVPSNVKVMKIADPEKCKKCDCTRENCKCDYFSYPDEPQPLTPGNLADLQLQILQKTAELKIWHDANEVVINRTRMAKLAGLVHLIRDHGFTERAARRMLKESELTNGKRYRVKYAQPYPGMYEAMQGPGAPPMPDYAMQPGDPMSGYAPMAPTQNDFIGVPEMSAQQTDPSVYSNSPEALPDQQSVQTADQAAQTGQKEVFDSSMIAGMLKSVKDATLVDRYLGDLMKALDRLGRIYFLFLWHNEEFMERYGKSDLPELEDGLRNSFEGLGDLVLFLRAKSVSPLEGTGELGEPTVDNSALN